MKTIIIDKATFEKPLQYPEGVDFMIVNGFFAVDNGDFHDLKSGMVLRKK